VPQAWSTLPHAALTLAFGVASSAVGIAGLASNLVLLASLQYFQVCHAHGFFYLCPEHHTTEGAHISPTRTNRSKEGGREPGGASTQEPQSVTI
jgi:hypothetical protein